MSKLMFGKLISKLQLSKSPEEREGKRLWSGPTQFDTHRCCVLASLVNQTAPTSVLDVLHHQHEEGGSGHSGTVFVTHVGIWI